MLITRDDLRFWDVRTRERRIRQGELTPNEVKEQLAALHDSGDKATISAPLEEPDDRAHERRPVMMVRVTPPDPRSVLDLDDLDDIDDDEDDDDDLDDEDDDEDDDLPLPAK